MTISAIALAAASWGNLVLSETRQSLKAEVNGITNRIVHLPKKKAKVTV